MRVLSCLLLAVSVSAAPVNLNFTVTPNFINSICAKAQDPARAAFVLPWAVDPPCNASPEVKQQMADFINAFHSGQYPVPHTQDEFTSLIQSKAPQVASIFTSVLNEAIRRYREVTPAAQQFLLKWNNRAYANLDSNRVQMFINAMSDSYEFITDITNLAKSTADWDSLNAQFPAIGNLYNSQKVQALISFLKNLGPDYDWATADQDTLNQVMQMSLAEFLPQSSD